MKAILIRQPSGLQNTNIEEVEDPKEPVVIRVTSAGQNPIDINVILGKVNYQRLKHVGLQLGGSNDQK